MEALEEHAITVNGQEYLIKPYRDHGKNAIARVKGNVIYIKIPRHWNSNLAWKIGEKLKNRIITHISKGRYARSEPSFFNLENINVLGEELSIQKIEENRKTNTAKIGDGRIMVRINNSLELHEKKEVVNELIRKSISGELLPKIVARVSEMNNRYFQSPLGKVSIRQQSSRWGSCSGSNNISINYSLLFLPQEILDYVIVHELTHTKVRNHSEKFWNVVEGVMPDFKERRRWLKKEARKELAKIFEVRATQ